MINAFKLLAHKAVDLIVLENDLQLCSCDLQHDSTESGHTVNGFHAPVVDLVLAKDKQRAVNQAKQYGQDDLVSRLILAFASS